MQQKREVKVLLSDSFKELVLEKPVEKITIKQITDRAGVIRVTFYNHFQDKYELLEWICREEVINPSRILFQNGMQREAVTLIFTALLKNKVFYSHVAHMTGQNSFESILRKLISETITECFPLSASGRSEKYGWISSKWIAEYYSRSFTFVLMSWIDKDMTVPPEEMVKLYELITKHSLIDPPVEI